MKKKLIKILSLSLCAALTALCAGSVTFAANNGKEDTAPSQGQIESAASEPEKITKDETVYVIARADGTVNKIIVSEHLTNALSSAVINDETTLSDVVNVKGDEQYRIDGTECVWNADGNDIYYRGSTEKALPFSVKVTYRLDGKEVSPDSIKGKSGKVSIRFDYTNNLYTTEKINGKDERIYVPFAMITGLLLDGETFRNVEVTNGKKINDGTRTAVVGIAFPGLQENLGISKEDADIPSWFEINADVTGFTLGMTVTVASSSPFGKLDLSELEEKLDLSGSVKGLTDAVGQIIDGVSELYNGLDLLYTAAGELEDGTGRISDGASALYSGTTSLDSGAGQLKSGAEELSSGLDKLASSNEALNGGAKQVFETLLSTAGSQLSAAGIEVPELTVSNYGTVLDGVIASLDSEKVYAAALEAVTEAVKAKSGYIEQQVTDAVRAEVVKKVTEAVREQVRIKVTEAVKENVRVEVTKAVRETVAGSVVKAATGMDKSSYDSAATAGMISPEIQAAVDAAIEENMKSENVLKTIESKTAEQIDSEAVTALIESNTDAQMGSDEIKSVIDSNTAQQMGSKEVKETISINTEAQIEKAISDNMASTDVTSKLSSAADGAKQIASLKASLDNYNTFYKGVQTYTAGVSEAAKGAKSLSGGAAELKDGASKLNDGAKELSEGASKLNDSIPELKDGIKQLCDGASALKQGLDDFNTEGIQKIADLINGDVQGLIDRINATSKIAESYRSFAGIPDSMKGNVKFIYRTEEIE